MKKLITLFIISSIFFACSQTDENFCIENKTAYEQEIYFTGLVGTYSVLPDESLIISTPMTFNHNFEFVTPTDKFQITSNGSFNWQIINGIKTEYSILNTLSIDITLKNILDNTVVCSVTKNSSNSAEIFNSAIPYLQIQGALSQNGFNYILDGSTKVFYKIDSSTAGQLVISSL